MDFDHTDAVFNDTPLIRAIVRNDQQEVREVLNRGFSANLTDNRGWTPLHEAVIEDARIGCLKELLRHSSANINSQTFLGETPLFLACRHNCLQGVQLLLQQPKCNVNLFNSEGISPLHIACNKGNLQIVKLLTEFEAEINSQDVSGYTPLHEVVSPRNSNQVVQDEISLDICQHLLCHGANQDIVEHEGNYPFHFACQNGLLNSLNLLYKASKHSDLKNARNKDGRSPLMLAVSSHNSAVVKALLSHGANPNVADKARIIALHLAAHSPHFDIFKMIHRATSNECILKYCTFDEHRDFKKLLRGKRINSLICLAIDTDNLQFLNMVLESNFDAAVIQCPVIHGKNIEKKRFTLHTPISFLLESKMSVFGERIVDFLLTLINHRIPLKVVTGIKSSIKYIKPICAAMKSLNDCSEDIVVKCLQVLMEHGADPDEPHGKMHYAIQQACMFGCADAVLIFLKYSNVLEPEDVLKWIESESEEHEEKVIEMLLPLSPYYIPSDSLLPDMIDNPRRKILLTPCVYPLANYCRSVIRRNLHEETKSSPVLFKQKLLSLGLPKEMYLFLNYM